MRACVRACMSEHNYVFVHIYACRAYVCVWVYVCVYVPTTHACMHVTMHVWGMGNKKCILYLEAYITLRPRLFFID